ncbi:hypothetical protein [Cellulomonas sp. NPDC089187]|uniref:hypothetical protein n=1 Tax=Cellulomonas sp. NPDC089187 TaxID=3154970 RepID=UPI00342EB0FA
MAYELDAFIAPLHVARELSTRLPGTTLVPLRSDLALVLRPDDVELIEPEQVTATLDGLTVARVEADFFGGTGWQSAWFYRDGRLEWSDVENPTTDPDAATWPINRALADLGHRPTRRAPWNPALLLDSFGDVGLGHCHSNNSWVHFAHEGGDGAAITRSEERSAQRFVG